MKQSVYIIIPAYNESTVICETVSRLSEHDYTIVVVDDGSSDNTEKILTGFPIHYIRHSINLGQGAALQTGISYAFKKGAEFFVTFDADGQHSPDDIAPMLNVLYSKETDIVFGSRFLSNGLTNISIVRRFSIQVARFLNFILTGILLSDAHNGLRVFNRRAASSIFLVENGMSHASEILIQARKQKLRIAEYPVRIMYTDYSKGKGQSVMSGFKIIQDIFLYKIFK